MSWWIPDRARGLKIDSSSLIPVLYSCISLIRAPSPPPPPPPCLCMATKAESKQSFEVRSLVQLSLLSAWKMRRGAARTCCSSSLFCTGNPTPPPPPFLLFFTRSTESVWTNSSCPPWSLHCPWLSQSQPVHRMKEEKRKRSVLHFSSSWRATAAYAGLILLNTLQEARQA